MVLRRSTRFLDSSDEDDSECDTPNPIPFPKPPGDSEDTSSPQTHVPTRDGRSTKRPIHFHDSGYIECGNSVRLYRD